MGLAPYFLVCVEILLVLRRERAREISTVGAAGLSMSAIAYVVGELFRSPVDVGTRYLPCVAVASIAAMALAFLFTRRDTHGSP